MYRSSGGGAGPGAGTGFGSYGTNMNQYGLPDEQNANYNNNSSSAPQQQFKQRQGGGGGGGGGRHDGHDDYAPPNRGGDRRTGGDRDRYDRPQRRGPPQNRSNRHDAYAYDETPAPYTGKQLHFWFLCNIVD